MVKIIIVYSISYGKSEGKRPLGRLRRRWEDNITTDLREIKCGDVDWTTQDRAQWRIQILSSAPCSLTHSVYFLLLVLRDQASRI
jgi:hypothetical protein